MKECRDNFMKLSEELDEHLKQPPHSIYLLKLYNDDRSDFVVKYGRSADFIKIRKPKYISERFLGKYYFHDRSEDIILNTSVDEKACETHIKRMIQENNILSIENHEEYFHSEHYDIIKHCVGEISNSYHSTKDYDRFDRVDISHENICEHFIDVGVTVVFVAGINEAIYIENANKNRLIVNLSCQNCKTIVRLKDDIEANIHEDGVIFIIIDRIDDINIRKLIYPHVDLVINVKTMSSLKNNGKINEVIRKYMKKNPKTINVDFDMKKSEKSKKRKPSDFRSSGLDNENLRDEMDKCCNLNDALSLYRKHFVHLPISLDTVIGIKTFSQLIQEWDTSENHERIHDIISEYGLIYFIDYTHLYIDIPVVEKGGTNGYIFICRSGDVYTNRNETSVKTRKRKVTEYLNGYMNYLREKSDVKIGSKNLESIREMVIHYCVNDGSSENGNDIDVDNKFRLCDELLTTIMILGNDSIKDSIFPLFILRIIRTFWEKYVIDSDDNKLMIHTLTIMLVSRTAGTFLGNTGYDFIYDRSESFINYIHLNYNIRGCITGVSRKQEYIFEDPIIPHLSYLDDVVVKKMCDDKLSQLVCWKANERKKESLRLEREEAEKHLERTKKLKEERSKKLELEHTSKRDQIMKLIECLRKKTTNNENSINPMGKSNLSRKIMSTIITKLDFRKNSNKLDLIDKDLIMKKYVDVINSMKQISNVLVVRKLETIDTLNNIFINIDIVTKCAINPKSHAISEESWPYQRSENVFEIDDKLKLETCSITKEQCEQVIENNRVIITQCKGGYSYDDIQWLIYEIFSNPLFEKYVDNTEWIITVFMDQIS